MIYVIGQKNRQWKSLPVKIGYSSNPSKRLKGIQTGNPCPLCIRKLVYGTITEEKKIHTLLHEFKTNGEWFVFNGHAVNILNKILSSQAHLDFVKLALTVEKVIAKKNSSGKVIVPKKKEPDLWVPDLEFESWVADCRVATRIRQSNSGYPTRRANEYTLSQEDREAISRVYRQMGIRIKTQPKPCATKKQKANTGQLALF